MTNSDDALALSVGWGACEECGEDTPDVLRVGTPTDRRTLCRECRHKDRRLNETTDEADA